MRSLRSLLVLGISCGLVLVTSGCTVIEEMDAAAAKMPTKTPSETPQPAAAAAAGPNALLESSKQWWDKATSLAPGEIDTKIVNCRIGQSAQFMSKDDCLTRGGVPQGKS